MFICLYLRLKKENFLTADDNGLTLIHADEDRRDLNNSDPNRFDMMGSPMPNAQLPNYYFAGNFTLLAKPSASST